MNFELFRSKPDSKKVGFIHDTRPKDEDFRLLGRLTLEHSTSFIIAHSPKLATYKRNLLIKLLCGFLLFLFFIFERTLHHVIQKQELTLIHDLQTFWFGKIMTAKVFGSTFYYVIGKMGEFRTAFLMVTHFFMTLFVGVDALIALKMVVVSFLSIFVLAVFSLLNGEPRPYWEGSKIKAFYCDGTYSDPGIITFLFFFLIIYSYQSFGRKDEEFLETIPFETSFEEDESSGFYFNERQKKWLSNGFLVFSLLIYFTVLFLRFLTGLEFMTNYFLNFIVFVAIYSLVINMDGFLEEVIKQTTILKLYARRKLFYWLIFLLVIEGLACVVYFQVNSSNNLLYIQNYLKCQSHNVQNVAAEKLYNEILGLKETFQSTAVVFAIAGLVFGASQTFRAISSINWYKGPIKMRLLRILIANLAMAPSWIFVFFQDDLINYSSHHFMGLSNFMVDCIHYFLLYYGLFGLIPVYIYLYFGLAFMDLKFSLVLTH